MPNRTLLFQHIGSSCILPSHRKAFSTCAKSEKEGEREKERDIDSYHAMRRISIYSPPLPPQSFMCFFICVAGTPAVPRRPHHPRGRGKNKEERRAEWNNKPSDGRTDRHLQEEEEEGSPPVLPSRPHLPFPPVYPSPPLLFPKPISPLSLFLLRIISSLRKM